MLHHVSIGVADLERAARFYDAALGALGFERVMEVLPYAIAYGDAEPKFWVQLPYDRRPAGVGNGVHFGFVAPTASPSRNARRVDSGAVWWLGAAAMKWRCRIACTPR